MGFALPRCVMGLSAVCDCGISWPYSLFLARTFVGRTYHIVGNLMSPNSLNSTQISIFILHMGTWVLHILTTTRLSFVLNGTEYAQIAKVQATANCKFASNLLATFSNNITSGFSYYLDFLQIKHNTEFAKKRIKHFHMLLQNILFFLFFCFFFIFFILYVPSTIFHL